MLSSMCPLAAAAVLATAAPLAGAQVNSNDHPFNNGGDVVFIYSSPSSGFTSLAFPPDVTGDLYWKAASGFGFMNSVDALLGSAMEVDGYYESLFDTDWTTTPSFYVRHHGAAVPDSGGLGGLEPLFFSGAPIGSYGDTTVLVGPSGFGNPCTVAPSLCSPSGGTCPPPGFVNGYLVDLFFGSTPGTGIVLPADGTSASDTATTWFVHGGMTASGGVCGLGDYDLQDIHSTDETQADSTGNGSEPLRRLPARGRRSGPGGGVFDHRSEPDLPRRADQHGRGHRHGPWRRGGRQRGGAPPTPSTCRSAAGWPPWAWRSATWGAPPSPTWGSPGLSLTPLPNPGLPALGGSLLVLPDGLFNSTSGVWQGAVTATTFVFTAEGAFVGAQLAIPTTAAGAVVYAQGVTFSLLSFSFASSGNSSGITMHS